MGYNISLAQLPPLRLIPTSWKSLLNLTNGLILVFIKSKKWQSATKEANSASHACKKGRDSPSTVGCFAEGTTWVKLASSTSSASIQAYMSDLNF